VVIFYRDRYVPRMMNPNGEPRRVKWLLANWPFIAGDLFLLVFAGLIIHQGDWVNHHWQVAASGAAVLAGSILLIAPCIMDHRLTVKKLDANILAAGLEPIQNLSAIASQIAHATAQWQTVQETADQTTLAIKEIAERMTAEATAFTEFLKKANDTEKQHLRLELEKLRRAEGEWLQVTVAVLDHIFALHQAGVRSGQPNLIDELSRFQNACRDVARRVGLVPVMARPGEPFDPVQHQTAPGGPTPPPTAQIAEVIATGYNFQGQLIRRALVSLSPMATSASNPDLTATSGADSLAEPTVNIVQAGPFPGENHFTEESPSQNNPI
jgi:molecular chaperone GrpE (heat shock protein)